jgi:hypothetical protein
MIDRPLLLPTAAFAAGTAFGAAVSVREGVRGEPLGVDLPGRIGVHLAAGWGSGLSAPWPMPALALATALRGQSRAARTTAVAVGAGVLIGTLIEPVTWGRRARSPLIATAVGVNLLSAVALLNAGLKNATASA